MQPQKGRRKPPQKRRGKNKLEYVHHIPTELLEQILLNLPVKSLTRFSTVSKSWNSTIHSRDFAERYRGREMIVMKTRSVSDAAFAYPLSSPPWGKPTKVFIRPSPGSLVRASCGELWCVEFKDSSIYLYNPSMRAYRELPASSSTKIRSPVYGLGYDSVADDYKVLKFDRHFTRNYEVYSRRSDSWRMFYGLKEKIRVCMSLPLNFSFSSFSFLSTKGVFVNGLLYWILIRREKTVLTILSFDLSTEKFGKVAMPESSADQDHVDLGVLRGKLCVYSDERHGRGVMWVHDEGVWTKEFVIYYYYFYFFRTKEVFIKYSHVFPKMRKPLYSYNDSITEFFSKRRASMEIKPLYSYNDNITAFAVTTDGIISKIFVYEDGSTQFVVKDFFGCGILDGFAYVESMVKP